MTRLTSPASGRSAGPVPPGTLRVVLAAGLLMGTVTQFLLGALAPAITRDLGLTASRFGAAVTALFAVGTAAAATADRVIRVLGPRRTYLAAQLAVGTALLVLGTVPTQLALAAAVVLAGGAMGVVNPTTNAVIARDVAGPHRTRVVGYVQSGVQAGALLAGFTATAAVLLGGWQRAVVVVSAGAFAVAAATHQLLPADAGAPREARPDVPHNLRHLAHTFAVYAFFMAAGAAVVFAYLPLYAAQHVGFTHAAAGALAAVFGVVGIAARVALTRMSFVSGGRLPRVMFALGTGAAISLLMVAAAARAPWMLWAAALVFGATAVSWPAVLMAALVEIAGARFAARLTSWVFVAFYLGLLATPAAFGVVVEGPGYGPGWMLAAALFAVAAVVGSRVRTQPVPAGQACFPTSHPDAAS